MDTALPPALPHGEVTSIRSLPSQLCDDQVLTFAGPPDPDGRATYWVELCLAHADAGLDGFPTTHQSRSTHSGRCGNVVEFRDVDTILRSHADLWLRPLLGVHADDHDGDWAATLTLACEQLQQRGADNRGNPYYDALTAMQMALEYAADGNKRMICTALSHAESLAWDAYRGHIAADPAAPSS